MGTVIYSDRFERKRMDDMAFALTKHIQEQTMKNRLNGLCGGLNPLQGINNEYTLEGINEPIYTTKDMEYEQSRQRRLTYAACFADLKEWVDRLQSALPDNALVSVIAVDIADKLLTDWGARAR